MLAVERIGPGGHPGARHGDDPLLRQAFEDSADTRDGCVGHESLKLTGRECRVGEGKVGQYIAVERRRHDSQRVGSIHSRRIVLVCELSYAVRVEARASAPSTGRPSASTPAAVTTARTVSTDSVDVASEYARNRGTFSARPAPGT